MTPSQIQIYSYFIYALALMTYVVLFFAEARLYRATHIKGLIPMMIGNVVGVLCVGLSLAFQLLLNMSPARFAVINAVLFAAQAIFCVWGTLKFLRVVHQMAAAVASVA